jgi:hypothetical protein
VRYHIIVEKNVSLALGACGLQRRGLLNLLNGLYHNLEGRADEFRSERHPEDETLFLFRDFLLEAGVWHEFVFVVDDTTASSTLLVRAMAHRSRPLGN